MKTEEAIKSQIDKHQSEGKPVPDSIIQQIAQGGISLVIKLLLLLFDSKNRWKKLVKEATALYQSLKAEFETLKQQVQQLLSELEQLKAAKAETGNEALTQRLADLERRQAVVDEGFANLKNEVAAFMTTAKEQLDQLPEKVSEDIKQQAETLSEKITTLEELVEKKADKKK